MESEKQLVAIVPSRLCAGERAPKPTREDPLVQMASDWQSGGSSAEWWGIGGAAGSAGPERMYEVRGLMASMGEKLAVIVMIEHELDCWELELPAARVDQVAKEMARRALADLAATYVISLGHDLANLTGRVLALDLASHDKLDQELKTRLPPGSSEKADWLSLSKVRELRRIAFAVGSTDLTNLVAPAHQLRTKKAWMELEESRGGDFHRWRPQSAGIVGAALGQFGVTDGETKVYPVTAGREVGRDLPGKVADQIQALGRGALRELTAAMESVSNAMVPVIERTTALRFRSTGQDSPSPDEGQT